MAARRWNKNLKAMPAKGRFEVLRGYSEVYRHEAGEVWVIDPLHGRIFTPYAWRPAQKKRSAKPRAHR